MRRTLDLRTGKPVWLGYRTTKIPEHPLERDIRTDVLVVGAGISGAMTADLLTQAGHDVVVIDRRGARRGSTPATTALVQYEIDMPLLELSASIGSEKALRAWRRARLAVLNLKSRIEELGIDCHMVPRETLYLAGNVLTGTALREEAQARAAAGLSARYLTAGQLADAYGIKREGAIASRDNLALDPVRLTAGLLERSIARGARLHAPEEAVDFVQSADGVRVSMKSGHRIEAGHVVLATGYELADIVKDTRHRIISTWAIATGRQRKSALVPGEPLIWEASDPYLYLRTTHDGRIICGGEDAGFEDEEKRDALLAEKTARISRKLAKLLPAIDPEPQYAWAGSFGNTTTGLPLIGPVPHRPRIFALMGYGGNGITFSRIAAELISTALAGRIDADADIFAF
ncbi:NAD(P)/FAD-dependent oxidoreductase [Pelagibacterium halotolerans]|uniref:Putative oxidoreductase n=1 Tax=Pelagibacterium halotolerans (strain DSM 22347 / JCM 15775 / CGMCC 1.7692 / B2) TaxID=1082931 RepID=G4RFV4_PELHB|nr:FAD-binding oxidoreductase [Pelagibacterium halotolerans]AEQ50997.1 putative oxidoreductase [Pelagibacterium halotolerans B2]QJR19109.1 FAD-binding oxidoreductase [Pelagibacterium halotolerans]SEA02151.1 Glycine/D-amino acid oxidase [Pelagibacterium halotolerans]